MVSVVDALIARHEAELKASDTIDWMFLRLHHADEFIALASELEGHATALDLINKRFIRLVEAHSWQDLKEDTSEFIIADDSSADRDAYEQFRKERGG